MGKTKYTQFYEILAGTLNSIDPIEAKISIGDSINNNRTLTVGQVIRFLQSSGTGQQVNLGLDLEIIFTLLKEDIVESRNNLRTDAVDINEFLNYYEATVLGLGEFRDLVGRNVTLVA